jgi:hypothetical protein
MIKICPICEKEFKGQRVASTYCSYSCRGEGQRANTGIVCLFCGTSKRVKPHKRTQKYCSVSCRSLHTEKMHSEVIEKSCTKCKTVKPREGFPLNSRNPRLLTSICRDCSNQYKDPDYYKKNRDKSIKTSRASMLRRTYNITESEYDKMLKEQNEVCKLCGKPPSKKRLAVDHCHKTGKIRGLLCSFCNTGIGMLKDDVVLLQKAIEYLSA